MMLSWGPSRRLWYGATRAAGLGFLAGALELVGQAATLQLPLGFGGFLSLGLVALVSMAALAAVAGLVVGPIVHLPLRESDASQAIAAHLGVVGGLLCGFYLWQGAAVLLNDGRAPAALAMAAMPIGFAGVVYFNARFWVRRAEIGVDVPVGWLPASGAVALLVAVGSAAAYAARDTGGGEALEGDRNVLIVSVDGLRRDHLRAFAADAPPTPRLDALAAEGVVFLDAVSPTPESAPAHATLLTGLHPLRHRVLRPGDGLSGGFATLARILEREGYATGAFVSSADLDARSGLAQGFRTYADDVGAPVRGMSHLGLLRHAAGLFPRSRDGSQTVAAFGSWLEAHADTAFFAWVHLAEPATAAGSIEGYRAAVGAVDARVGDVLAMIDQRGLRDDTLVIVLGTYGSALGERDEGFHHRGLRDEVVRVPLLLRAPGLEARVTRVEPQVRLMDVMPTVLAWLELGTHEESEGVELVGYIRGTRERAMWTSLVGWAPGDDAPLIGLRNNGVKYVRDLDTGREWLWSVSDEAVDLAAEQPKLLEQARALVAPEGAAMSALLAD